MFGKFLVAAMVCVSALADPNKTIVENAQATPTLSTLVTVLTTTGYEPVLNALSSPGNFTVFAPNDAAFTAAGLNTSEVAKVTQVLYYHVLGAVVKSTDLQALQFPNSLMTDSTYTNLGGLGQVTGITKNAAGVTINFGIPGVAAATASVVTADVLCSNGVVHIIDKVLMFPKTVAETATAAGLTELVNALTKASLVDAVVDTKTLTIFAPTDAAMLAANWSSLDVPTLTAVLKYHVVPAVAYSTDLKATQAFPTLQGPTVTVTVADGVVKANDATVTVANALTKNGVVHVIDKVLIPPAAPTAAPGPSTASPTAAPGPSTASPTASPTSPAAPTAPTTASPTSAPTAPTAPTASPTAASPANTLVARSTTAVALAVVACLFF